MPSMVKRTRMICFDERRQVDEDITYMTIMHRPKWDSCNNIVIIYVSKRLGSKVSIKVLRKLTISRPRLTEGIQSIHCFIFLKPQFCNCQCRKCGTKAMPSNPEGTTLALEPE